VALRRVKKEFYKTIPTTSMPAAVLYMAKEEEEEGAGKASGKVKAVAIDVMLSVSEWYLEWTLRLMLEVGDRWAGDLAAKHQFYRILQNHRDAVTGFTMRHRTSIAQGLGISSLGLCRKALPQLHSVMAQMRALTDKFSQSTDAESERPYKAWLMNNGTTIGASWRRGWTRPRSSSGSCCMSPRDCWCSA